MPAVVLEPIVDEVDPLTAYRLLESRSDAVLIDVRTRAEWSFVGLPDVSATGRPLWLVEWAGFPEMAANPGFLDTVMQRIRGQAEGGQGDDRAGDQGDDRGDDRGDDGGANHPPERLLFICRSGQRSMAAARAVAEALAAEGVAARCSNVAEGFEGELDSRGQRGRHNGWKARGLPWRQT